MVAQAPLVATRSQLSTHTGSCNCWRSPLTCCQRVMYADSVSAHEMFDSLVCREVNGMGRPCADDYARHATPQTQYPLAGSHSVCALDHAIVDRGRRRVQDLHSSLYSSRTLGMGIRQALGGAWMEARRQTLIASMGYITVCSCLQHQYIGIGVANQGLGIWGTNRYACEGTGYHIL